MTSTDTDRLAEAEKHIRSKLSTSSRDSIVVNGAALAIVMTEFDRLLSDLSDERAARVEAEDAYGRVAIAAADRLSELEAAQARLDKGRAVLTDRIVEWAESEESWKRRPPKYLGDIEMRDREHAIAEEVSGLLEEFDRALGLGEEADDGE